MSAAEDIYRELGLRLPSYRPGRYYTTCPPARANPPGSTGLSDYEGAKPLSVTVATARKLSGLGNTTIWRLIRERQLETVHVGRCTLIRSGRLRRCSRRQSRNPVAAGDRARPADWWRHERQGMVCPD